MWRYLKELPAALRLVVFGSEVERIKTCRRSQGTSLRGPSGAEMGGRTWTDTCSIGEGQVGGVCEEDGETVGLTSSCSHVETKDRTHTSYSNNTEEHWSVLEILPHSSSNSEELRNEVCLPVLIHFLFN